MQQRAAAKAAKAAKAPTAPTALASADGAGEGDGAQPQPKAAVVVAAEKSIVHVVTPKGMTALMHAAQNGYVSIVVQLLEAGAFINQQNVLGEVCAVYVCVLLRAAACCCVLLRAAACCCVLLWAAVGCAQVMRIRFPFRLPPLSGAVGKRTVYRSHSDSDAPPHPHHRTTARTARRPLPPFLCSRFVMM